MTKPLLIIVAIDEEFKIIKNLLKKVKKVDGFDTHVIDGVLGTTPVRVATTSMGPEMARSSTEKFLERGEYSGALILGYCGGLCPSLRVGDVVLPSFVHSYLDDFRFDLDVALNEEMGRVSIAEGVTYRMVPMTTQPQVIETPTDKLELYERVKAEAVDMETAEVIRAVRRKGLPVAAAKIVVDDSDTELPHFNDHFKKTKRMDNLSVGQVMIAQPGLSLKLKQNMKHGGEKLKILAPQFVTALMKHWKPRP